MKTLEDSFESKDAKEMEKEEKECNEETHALLNCVRRTVRYYLQVNIIQKKSTINFVLSRFWDNKVTLITGEFI